VATFFGLQHYKLCQIHVRCEFWTIINEISYSSILCLWLTQVLYLRVHLFAKHNLCCHHVCCYMNCGHFTCHPIIRISIPFHNSFQIEVISHVVTRLQAGWLGNWHPISGRREIFIYSSASALAPGPPSILSSCAGVMESGHEGDHLLCLELRLGAHGALTPTASVCSSLLYSEWHNESLERFMQCKGIPMHFYFPVGKEGAQQHEILKVLTVVLLKI